MRLFLTMLMLLAHVIADFNIQHLLATWKQKKWWEENCPDKLYKEDWKICLFMHSLTWSIMIMLPQFWYLIFCLKFIPAVEEPISAIFTAVVFANTFIHAWIDHQKCNKMKTSLMLDQCLHIIEIIATEAVCHLVLIKFQGF